jgi:hypothetical protein
MSPLPVVRGAALLAVLLAAGPLSAQTFAARGGSTGFGAEIGVGLASHVGLRLNGFGGGFNHSIEESGIRYDVKLKLGSAALLADVHPFAGNFRLTAGVATNGNRFDFTGQGTSGTYTINGVAYAVSDLGRLQGKVEFDSFAPYLGLGWGSAPRGQRRLFFSIDAGAMFQKPRASLTGSCAPAVPTQVCAQLQADLRVEEQQFRDAVNVFRLWPVINAGVGYRF